jgi:hypothetical protein
MGAPYRQTWDRPFGPVGGYLAAKSARHLTPTRKPLPNRFWDSYSAIKPAPPPTSHQRPNCFHESLIAFSGSGLPAMR